MPTRDTAWPNGTPCWVDYDATDVEAARAFYADVLGWTYLGGAPEYGGYLTCVRNDRAAAGMAPAQGPAQPPRWTTYLAADSVDATVGLVTGAGGTVLMAPMDVGAMGRMAIAQDPNGDVFGIWQAGEHSTGVQIYNEPGSLVWSELATRDVAAAKAFYGTAFGYRYTDLGDPTMPDYVTFDVGANPLGGMNSAPADGPLGWGTCFSVAETDAAVAAVERGGGKITMAAEDTPYGRFAVVEDPWGASFAVMQAPAG